jgi:para-aminobenzoate synthetase/4-amino-4-deoxychorismate lyase
VPIRTAVLDADRGTYDYGAGAGITWSSSPEAEDAEVRAKARILTRSHRPLALLETLRNDEHGLLHVADHLDRMAASARWFDIPFSRPAFERRLGDLPAAGAPERVRLLLQRDGTLEVQRAPLDPAPDPVRLAVDVVVTRSDDPYCCHKTTWRRHYEQARERHRDADDVVLVNERGNAVECTVANLAYRIGEHWYVPPLSDGGLPGIARRQAVTSGAVAERSIAATDLTACDELAVLNDLRGWRSARLVDRRTDEAPGS